MAGARLGVAKNPGGSAQGVRCWSDEGGVPEAALLRIGRPQERR